MEYVNIGVVVTIILGLTQWLKERLKLESRAAEALSFVIGATLGGLYQYSVTKPVDLTSWLAVAFVALLMALVPSGIYKIVSQQVDKIAAK
jgi:hypothetical protein